MFTEADLEALVPRKVFDRGAAYYYEDDAVGRITQKGDTYKAKVRGTETYHVELTVQLSGPPQIHCDCPYDHGDVCKHGIALGLAVLDLLGPAEPLPAPVAMPALAERPWGQLLGAAWPLVSDKDKQAYLLWLLHQQPQLVAGFLESFEFDLDRLLVRSQPKPRPSITRYVSFVQTGQDILRTGHAPDLLPHLLRYDWRPVPAAEAPRLAALLAEAARLQPEAALDAVMERIETYLAATQRGPGFYLRLVSWLKALHAVPTITEQVRLFASELWKQHGRRPELRSAITEAGFAPLPTDLQEAALQKKKTEKAKATPPKQRGRVPKSR